MRVNICQGKFVDFFHNYLKLQVMYHMYETFKNLNTSHELLENVRNLF